MSVKINHCPKSTQPSAGAGLTQVLWALGDPVRLHIVRLAAERERACNEFELDLPGSTLSHHFKVLTETGIIDRRRDGTRLLTFVRRAELDREFPGLLDAVLGTTGVKRK